MPWKDVRAMSQKIEFVDRACEPGANIAQLCREYGISRPTAHRWLKRFRVDGYAGLEERSRRPKKSPKSTSGEMIFAILDAREAHPTWGPKKLVVLVKRKFGRKAPTERTIARVLDRFGRIRRRKLRRVSLVIKAPDVSAKAANDL